MKALFTAFLLTALISPAAFSQSAGDDTGDFVNNDGRAPDNSDSEQVPGLSMGYPEYGGSGCPQGSVSSALSPDQKTLSVLFDSYVAEAGAPNGLQRNVAECQLKIPFHVPDGYKVSVVKLDYRGFTTVPKGGRSTFAAGFRFSEGDGGYIPGRRTRVMRAKVFAGPTQEDFNLTSRIQGAHWSACGKSINLEAESRVLVQSNPQMEQVMTTIDSLDAQAIPVVYHLRWKRCSAGEEPPPPRPRPTPPPRPPRPPRFVR